MKVGRKSVVLKVGQEYHLKIGRDRIIYAGQPGEDVYSIVQKKGSGYQGFAWNLFYPVKCREVTIDGVPLEVESVNPDEICFRVTEL